MLRRFTSIALALCIICSMFAIVSVPTVQAAGSYYNAGYLESYASNAYNESGLGATYSSSSTTWKTWAPSASSVKLKLYSTGSDAEAGSTVLGIHSLTKNSTTGVWSKTLSGDFKNVYYTYLVTVNGTEKETQDAYSKAVGVNGNRSMVVDLDSTDPAGWSSDRHVLFNYAQEAVVWETHVREFSISSTSGVSSRNKGKYLAFTEGGTNLSTDSSISTCLDYLVEQGINCVQLMPVFDFESGDERYPNFHAWGYDPKNYNVPEGLYSSNPYNGNTRITEFKKMVQALHDRGIAVVMDVVYNHTPSADSALGKTVPNYYYRMWSDTGYCNGSGCGNETASDKLMFRKYMVESVKYWAKEYHIDGFRFDLMGVHDVATMNAIRSGLDGLYSDGSGRKILIYGEPWTGGEYNAPDGGATAGNIGSLNARVGLFCDAYRTAIKGGSDDDSDGFIQGNTGYTSAVVNGVKGYSYYGAKAPSQIVAYADAHDNLILWDKVLKSNGQSNVNATDDWLTGQIKEALALLTTSQGIPFIAAGTEFCRTKYFDGNSYASGDSVNAMDWSRLKTYSNVANYYKGLLKIRANYSPLKGDIFSTPSVQSSFGDVVAYTYSNGTYGEWGKMCVLVNSGSQGWDITLDGSGWVVVADGIKAGLECIGTVPGNTYYVPPRSACVLVESSTFANLRASNAEYRTLTVKHMNDGKVLKTTTAEYLVGSTYRATADEELLETYEVSDTSEETTGLVESGKDYVVTINYTKLTNGSITVNYVDQSGAKIKDTAAFDYEVGQIYSISAPAIMGYQLDTDNYPPETYGEFETNKEITFTYKPLDDASVTIHYYNMYGWDGIRCYSYTADGTNPNGDWNTATLMTSEGDGWFTATVPATSAYVIFHPETGDGQDPAQWLDGYIVAGSEVWIENKVVTFNSKVITSHIYAETGEKISENVIDSKSGITSASSYTTTVVSESNVIKVPFNATSTYSAGVVNVVYLYSSKDKSTATVYFDNTSYDWSKVYVYAYTASDELSSWPGTLMSYDSALGLYKFTLPLGFGSGRVIFTESADATTNRYPADSLPGLEVGGIDMIFLEDKVWTPYVPDNSSLTLSAAEVLVDQGETTTLTAKNARGSVSYTSSDTSVATVTASTSSSKNRSTGLTALITAVSEGSTIITARDSIGGKTAKCKVTVSSDGTITLSETDLSLISGKVSYVTEDAPNTVTWTSSDPSVVSVTRHNTQKGKLTAVKAGTAIITVTDSKTGKTATCKVTVRTGTININTTSLTLDVGKSAFITESSANTVTWKSSNPEVATVSRYNSAKGKVVAKAPGSATITVTDTTGASATCVVTVREDKTGGEIVLGATELSLVAGKSAYITENSTNVVTWTSSDPSIATVSRFSSAKGKVTGVKAGTVTITATDSTGATAKCNVTVTTGKFTLNPTSLTVYEGKTATITEDTSKEVTWTSSNPNVAKVAKYNSAQGKVTAVKAGTATITATDSTGATATCIVTVKSVAVNPVIHLSASELTINEGVSTFITEDSPNTVSWTSSDSSIASVSRYSTAKGRVTAKKAGTVTITAKDTETGAVATCKVTVVATPIKISPKTITMSVGSYRYIFEDASNDVTWTSSDPSIATVTKYSSAQGKVVAKKAGKVTITVTNNVTGAKASCTVIVK